jgi:hypothetical protein
MDEIAEATIFGTVAEQPPLSSGTDLFRTARRQILTTPRNAFLIHQLQQYHRLQVLNTLRSLIHK